MYFTQYYSFVLISIIEAIFASSFSNTVEICNMTNYEGPQKDKPCVFPFKIGEIVYKECTNEKDPDGLFWCSTKVDKSGQHVGGQNQWGYCDQSCSFGITNFNKTIDDTNPRSREEQYAQNYTMFDFTSTQEDLTKNLKNIKTQTPIQTTTKSGPLNPSSLQPSDAPNTSIIKKDKNAIEFSMTQQNLTQNIQMSQTRLPSTLSTTQSPKSSTSTKSPATSTLLLDITNQPITSSTELPPKHGITRRPTARTTTKPIKVLKNEDRNNDYFYNDPNEYYEDYYDEYNDRPLGMDGKTSDGTWLPTFGKDTCGEKTDSGYVIGGAKAKGGEFPFMAALGRLTSDNRILFICGGTLINRRYIITAAHCHSLKPGAIPGQIKKAVLGATDLSELNGIQTWGATAKIYDINPEDIIQHEEYNPDIPEAGNDIALIRMPKVVNTILEDPKGSNILPVCMGWNDDIKMPTPQFRLSLVLGWGKDGNNKNDIGDISTCGAYSCVLRKAYVPIVPLAECRRKNRQHFQVYRNQHVCAGTDGRDTCSGDSGGPLLVKSDRHSPTFLLGVVSFGIKHCGTGVPGVYTNIQNFMPWIRSHLKP